MTITGYVKCLMIFIVTQLGVVN